VAVGQLNKLFGVAKPEGNTVESCSGSSASCPRPTGSRAIALATLFLLPRLNPRIPAGLVVLFGGIGLSAVLDLRGTHGVAVVATLPQRLPSLTLTTVPLTTYLAMVLPAIGVLLVGFSESLGVAHEFAEKHGYEVDSDTKAALIRPPVVTGYLSP
jgi:sulfate permease, SulP family